MYGKNETTSLTSFSYFSLKKFTFIDFGSGAGRTLFFFNKYFKNFYGIEFNKTYKKFYIFLGKTCT